jgi:hypothetical protein
MLDLPLDCPIEVRNRFDGTWSPGFRIAHVEADSVILRRARDGSLLPCAFDASDVRLAHAPPASLQRG